jgi:hypothetical protein
MAKGRAVAIVLEAGEKSELTALDLLDNVRRRQGQPQHAANIGLIIIDLVGGSDLRNRGMRAGLQHFAPPERSGDRLDHGVVEVAADGAPRWHAATRRVVSSVPSVTCAATRGVVINLKTAKARGLAVPPDAAIETIGLPSAASRHRGCSR